MTTITHPGFIMQEYLDARGLQATDLAQAAGLPLEDVTAYLEGQGEFTLNLALGMNELLQGEPDTNYWVNYYQKYKAAH